MNGFYNGYNMYPNYGYINTPAISPTRGAPLLGALSPTRGVLSRAPGLLSSTGLGNVATGAKAFSFSGLLNGASKTLGVINQAIPVVYQIKPIWNNAKTIFRVAKAMNSSDTNSNTTSQTNIKSTTTEENNKNNSPTFFN